MLFSVLATVYNTAPYLGACVQSVLSQTESDFELLRGTLQFYVMGNGTDISEFVDMDGTVYSIVEE